MQTSIGQSSSGACFATAYPAYRRELLSNSRFDEDGGLNAECRGQIERSSRVMIVANRLPLTIANGSGEAVRIQESAGGLASALRCAHDAANGLWIGASRASERLNARGIALDERLQSAGALGVPLSDLEIDAHYRRFSNEYLWPVLHGLRHRTQPTRLDWNQYVEVNRRFADVAVANYRPGDIVWVHDYHLMLVPEMIRARVKTVPIGFFLHTPLSQIIAEVREWLRLRRGLLGADIIAFQTDADATSFRDSLDTGALDVSVGCPSRGGERSVQIATCPVGIDNTWFERVARRSDVASRVAAIRADCHGPLFVGVDRLDYTKGIPERLGAFERLLAFEPGLRGRARFIQVAVPSREATAGYDEIRAHVESIVARINRTYGDPSWAPIEYIHDSLAPEALVALYRAADVMAVTPLRDGMNLVAKEFVWSRIDGDGVLVLSRGAGAAAELRAATRVDAWDETSIMIGFRHALAMPRGERQSRMRRLRAIVGAGDVSSWAERCLAPLREISRVRAS